MKKFKILNSPISKPGEIFLKEVNPYPKNLIKEGLVHHNPEYDAFETASTKNAILILNPVSDKREYLESELELVCRQRGSAVYSESKKAFFFIGKE
jgi:hypothetical protein